MQAQLLGCLSKNSRTGEVWAFLFQLTWSKLCVFLQTFLGTNKEHRKHCHGGKLIHDPSNSIQNHCQKVVSTEILRLCRRLDILKFDQTPLIYSVSYFNLGGLELCLWGISPPKSPPPCWWTDPITSQNPLGRRLPPFQKDLSGPRGRFGARLADASWARNAWRPTGMSRVWQQATAQRTPSVCTRYFRVGLSVHRLRWEIARMPACS